MSIKQSVIILCLTIIIIGAATEAFLFFQFKSLENIKTIKPVAMANTYIKIMFAGDLMFDRGIRYYAGLNGGNDYIFQNISGFLKKNDLNVVNLEGSITNNKSKSAGSAIGSANNYYLTFDPSVAKTLFDQNIKIVSLGNNHILNFGRDGLKQTKSYLDQAHVDYFGAPDYPKSISTKINNVHITFVNYNEFAQMDLEAEQKSTLEEIQKAKGFSDIIFVYCHWGVEYAPNPTAEQIVLAHQFIDAGADAVLGSHPHVTQPLEIYKNKRIYYSLGNFIFDQYFDENVRNSLGVIIKINTRTKQFEFTEQKFYLQSGGQTILAPALSARLAK